MDKTSILNQY